MRINKEDILQLYKRTEHWTTITPRRVANSLLPGSEQSRGIREKYAKALLERLKDIGGMRFNVASCEYLRVKGWTPSS